MCAQGVLSMASTCGGINVCMFVYICEYTCVCVCVCVCVCTDGLTCVVGGFTCKFSSPYPIMLLGRIKEIIAKRSSGKPDKPELMLKVNMFYR